MSQPPPGYQPGPQQPYPTPYGPPQGGGTQPQFGPPQGYGPPPGYGSPGAGQQVAGLQELGQQGFGPPLPTPPKRSRVGLVVAIVVGAVVLLGGLGLAAFFVFGTKTIDPASVQSEIVRVTQEAVHTAPTGVTCPQSIELKTGTTFTCTASIEAQDVSYTVTETDDQGNLTIKPVGVLLEVAPMADSIAKEASQKLGVTATLDCSAATGGKKVLVTQPGTPIRCTLVNSSDPTDTLDVTLTSDADGKVSYTSGG